MLPTGGARPPWHVPGQAPAAIPHLAACSLTAVIKHPGGPSG
jgi:hypothetical protein